MGNERSRSRAAALPWLLAILGVAALAWLLLTLTGVSDVGTSLITVAWGMIILSFLLNALGKRRQRRADRKRSARG
jgi:hypothetical protein